MLATLPAQSVHMCCTSPPYFGLRDYGTATWAGGDSGCAHIGKDSRTVSCGPGKQYSNKGSNEVFSGDCRCGATRTDSQIGLEATPNEYVAQMVEVFREVRRVLRDDGTLWLNLGDTYAAQRGGTTPPAETLAGGINGKGDDDAKRGRKDGYNPTRNASAIGLKHKDLIGIPWRVAFALQADGWWLRQDIIWSKPAPMPESVTDRCTKAHEYVFLLSKSERYYFDAAAIREASVDAEGSAKRYESAFGGKKSRAPVGESGIDTRTRPEGMREFDGMRNKRSVWTIATRSYSGAHFATMAPELAETCIKAGCPVGGVCLDPFGGAGTTGLVADRLQRDAILIELNPVYGELANRRINGDAPLFAEVQMA